MKNWTWFCVGHHIKWKRFLNSKGLKMRWERLLEWASSDRDEKRGSFKQRKERPGSCHQRCLALWRVMWWMLKLGFTSQADERTKESWAEQRSKRLKGKRASTPRSMLHARGLYFRSGMRRELKSTEDAAVLGGGEKRSHGRKLMGEESKIMKWRRKTQRRKALRMS